MTAPAPGTAEALTPGPALLAEIRSRLERGLALQAFAAAQPFEDLARWTGTAARILAGRLAMNLGSPRLGHRQHLLAYRHDRQSPEARYFFARTVLEFRGPLAAWELLARIGECANASPDEQADLCSLRARAAAHLRDFETAERWQARAEQLTPDKPWLAVERAFLLEQEDRYEAALATARSALAQPAFGWYRPGVQMTAHLLQLLDRDEEAVELLAEAARHLESGLVCAQLAGLQTELGRYEAARESLERFAALSPLLAGDPEARGWLQAQRTRVAYLLQDFPAAARHAAESDDPRLQELARQLSVPAPDFHRVHLPVEFVRQHHKTCAPATLATLGRFWGMPTDHLELAAAICYDGTPAHRQREWLEEHDWVVREFRLTWDSAVALLDRGVPLAVTTVETASAHLQAVIGYDRLRRTLLLRDPYQPYLVAAGIEPFLERYQSTGPHALALVPRARQALLADVELPEAALCDQLHAVELSLSRHDRARAQQAVDALMAAAPGHRLAWQARRSLAGYDGDVQTQRHCVERLLEQFPADANLQLGKLACLQEAPREERIAFLQANCAGKSPDPLLWQAYASELSADARAWDQALRLLQRSLRFRPVEARSFAIRAELFWNQRRLAEATELFRFATCLEDKREQFARNYFIAARHLKQTDAAMRFLQDRFQRFGAQSAQPGCTLFWALCELEQVPQAFEVLAAALRQRSEDAELLRFAADAYGRWGRMKEAGEALNAAEAKSPRAEWLRTAATVASYHQDQFAALSLWRQMLAVEPLALDAHRAVAQLLAETESPAAALRHLEQVCRQFPHHFGLHRLWIDWLREEGDTAVEPVLRHVLTLNDTDAWARRELALVLGNQRRFPEAFAEAALAVQLEPNSPFTFCVRGRLHALAGDAPAAQADFREAIRLSVDTGHAITSLIDTCGSHAERKAALAYVESELIRQVVFGDGLLAFREVARTILEPEELLASLRFAHQERPDLWHAHSALVLHLTDLDRLDEAVAAAERATARFPLLPRLWLDLARVHRARSDRVAEIQALEQAVRINPAWSVAARQLAEAHQRNGDLTKGRSILEQAIARDPLDALNHGCLAEILWQIGERPAALARVQQAAALHPAYDWAWNALALWAQQLEQPEVPVQHARDLTARRSGEARSWLRLAEMLRQPEDLPERLAALDKALALNPRSEEAYDAKAVAFVEAKRFDEALAACRPAAWGAAMPMSLRGRAAWVEAQRGNLPEAIRQMRAVLAENPDYYWGWRELSEWLGQTGAFPEALEAAKHLARLAPHDPVPLGYAADVKRRLDDRAGAKADFRRAMELDPAYAFAAFSLFDMQLEDGELDQAGETLAIVGARVNSDWVRARAARLAARQDRRDEALAILRELCASKTPDPWPIQAAAEAAVARGWHKHVLRLVEETLKEPAVNPQVGALWVERKIAGGKLALLKPLRQLAARGELGERALLAYVDALGEAGRRLQAARDLFGPRRCRRLLKRLVRQHHEWFTRNDLAWGKAGYAFIELNRLQDAIDWLSDWRTRPGAEPWMLYNLVIALQFRGRDEAARTVVEHALSLPVQDNTRQAFRLWAALEHALAGNTAAGLDLVKDLSSLPESQQTVRELVRSLATIQLQPEPRFDRELRRILKAFRAAHPGNRTMQRAFYRAAKVIARWTNRPWPILWAHALRAGPFAVGAAIAGGLVFLRMLTEWR